MLKHASRNSDSAITSRVGMTVRFFLFYPLLSSQLSFNVPYEMDEAHLRLLPKVQVVEKSRSPILSNIDLSQLCPHISTKRRYKRRIDEVADPECIKKSQTQSSPNYQPLRAGMLYLINRQN